MTVEKSALLVIDMQNDFCVPGGPLFVPGAPAIFDAVREAVDVARAKGIPVVWVVREHQPSGEDTEMVVGERGVALTCDRIVIEERARRRRKKKKREREVVCGGLEH